jgi:diguanylate cyclase (GGDEF)-like protein
MSVGDWIKRQNKATVFLIALSLFLVDETIDYITGPDVNISFFHLIPIFLIVWNSGFWAGTAYSFFCTVVIEWVEVVQTGHAFAGAQFFNACANMVFFTAFSFVLDKLNKNLEVITRMAERDGLTNLLNFNAFIQRAEQALVEAIHRQESVTVAYFDVDNFKKINDSLGHREGDEVLRMVGHAPLALLRETDLYGRVGGDEFVILLPGLSPEEAGKKLSEIFERLGRSLWEKQKTVTFSLGAVTFLPPPPNCKNAIHEADQLMYQAKRNGKNRLLHNVMSGERFGPA